MSLSFYLPPVSIYFVLKSHADCNPFGVIKIVFISFIVYSVSMLGWYMKILTLLKQCFTCKCLQLMAVLSFFATTDKKCNSEMVSKVTILWCSCLCWFVTCFDEGMNILVTKLE